MMDEYLTKEINRRLFELPPKSDAVNKAAEPNSNS